MNKILFTILILLACCQIVKAQAPYLDSTWLPVNGDRYQIYLLYGSVPSYAQDTGANITWDFDSLFGAYLGIPVDSHNFVYPDAWYIPCNNPIANFADGNDSFYNCYHKTNEGLFLTGYNFQLPDRGNVYGSYTKPQAYIKCNLRFHDEYRDTAKYSYNFTVDHSDSPVRGITFSYWKYDGYGTLKILGKEYDTVLRIHTTTMQKDTTYKGVLNNQFEASIVYEWYVPSMHVPVLIMTISWIINPTGSGNDTLRRDDYITFNQPSTSPPPSPPSPGIESSYGSFNDNSILIKGLRGSNINYELYDVSGRLLQSGEPLAMGPDAAMIPANDLSQGMYILKITNPSGQQKSIKLVKNY